MQKKIWFYSQKYNIIGVFIKKLCNCMIKKVIKGTGNKLNYNQAFLVKTSIKIIGNNNSVDISKNSRLINTNFIILGDNHKIEIGSDCTIKNSGFVFEDNNCVITIGEGTTIEGVHAASLEPYSSITIGKDCMLSAAISIRNSDSHSIVDNMNNKRINYAKNIFIGNHVWIGEGVRVLKGSVIEDNSIIGIGSVVTNNIPSNCVAVGIPAKVVKEHVNWVRKRIYE